MKSAVIVGSAGQDGTLLYSKLSSLGYSLVGIQRSSLQLKGIEWSSELSLENPEQIEHLVKNLKPDEVYYLAAVHQSAEDNALADPVKLYLTSESVNTKGVLYFLEAIRKHSAKTRLFYAASSHIFGFPKGRIQDELTPINPKNIYGITKAAAMQICNFYRENHGIYVSVGILYNHESALRRETFISKKIAKSAVRIKLGLQSKLIIGSTSAEADWGYAPDFVDAMTKILQVVEPDNYIIATGQGHKVCDFLQLAFDKVGLDWKLYTEERPSIIVRPPAVLIGDSTKLRNRTGWKPSMDFKAMVELLVDAELKSLDLI
ncbi:GDP-mannose 4,6-dehydratase [Oligoflexus tunisiensis]|uniref:GDP-mannose 4,6-dehydratase n=1 Tax=Oligoflexus tunisiensis TaxID=708132 RepID=UPI00114C9F9D|nr:GDP-mannose 4,6-dehydratase [Oligoflexus tunisiensis]